MIIIYPPKIEKSENGVRLSADIGDNANKTTLWIETEKKWSEYFINERSDAFLMGYIKLCDAKGSRHNMSITRYCRSLAQYK